MNYISNSFSLNMLPGEHAWPVHLLCLPVSVETARLMATDPNAVSVVGHADTAALFSAQLGVAVACDRATVTLTGNDSLLVGQYRGPRLPEGSTTLPEGATIEWWLITIA
jgi:hypothetical protein